MKNTRKQIAIQNELIRKNSQIVSDLIGNSAILMGGAQTGNPKDNKITTVIITSDSSHLRSLFAKGIEALSSVV